MSKVHSERPPEYRGPSKIPRFYNNSAALPPVDMSSGGQRNPSKLQQLQSNYQQRLMKEKEEKLIKMYEDNQRRALQKVNSQSKMTVRDFFKERRQMEQNVDNAHALPSMNTHYKIKRMDVQSDTDDPWVHRQNSNGSLKYSKIAKGRDKSNPLAPIDRNRGQNSMIPAPVPQKPQRHGRPWTLKRPHQKIPHP
ncbi:hypothetical protein FSP39_001311 [Pinctada imbricata]|uniref:Uncharacterized protein n=1 Tax=Pinctada imbricata TaxID=66713 RepID=A0AA88Y9W6_PINIB|nr:hypothetical protein FSP39_001311 [Pinctada imbricata]